MNGVFRQAVDWEHSFLGLASHGECVAALGVLGVSVVLFGVIVFLDFVRRSIAHFVFNGKN